MSGKKTINIQVDPELWKQAKVEAAKEGITLQEWLDKAIREKLDK
jgi:predicted HicB family RNase H-like nuclease